MIHAKGLNDVEDIPFQEGIVLPLEVNTVPGLKGSRWNIPKEIFLS